MANYLNDLFEGLTTGLKSVAGGFVEKGWRDNAEELFKQGQNYLTEIAGQYKSYIKQGEDILKSVDPSQQVEVGNRQTTEVGGDPTGQVQQIQGKEVNPNTVQSNPVQNSVRTQRGLEDLFRGYFNVQGQLANNPYGKGFATSLEGMYKAQQPEYKEYGDKLYRITPQGAEMIEDNTKVKRTNVSGVIPIPFKDGDNYGLKIPSRDEKGNLVWEVMPLDSEEEYQGQKDIYESKSLSPKEKIDNALQLFEGKKTISLNFGGLTGSKGRSGKQSKGEWDKLSQDVKKEVLDHVEASKQAILRYGSWDKIPDDIKVGLQGQQDYLINKRGQNRDDIANYIDLYNKGELTDKKLRQSIKTKTNYDVTKDIQKQGMEVQKLYDNLANGVKTGQINMQQFKEKVLQFYNSEKNNLYPDIRTQIEQLLKQYGLL